MAIENMFDRQVQSLADKVRRLEACDGKDSALLESIRKQVSGELINQGKLEVVSATMGELCVDESACQRLTDMVAHCSEHFYMKDRVLSAFVIPVAFRMRGPVDAPVFLTQADADSLATLALMIQRVTGCRSVAIDSRPFDKGLYFANARKVYRHLLGLEAGDKHPMEGIRNTVVRSAEEPEWQMLYFLGVQVSDLKGPRILNDEAIQRQLASKTYSAVWALTECKSVFPNKALAPQGKCHGVWYLNQGVLQGENAVRGHRLHSMLANFEQGVRGVKFFYVHEVMAFQVKLLMCSRLMAVEFKWKLMGAETLDGFKEALEYAIAMCVPTDEIRELRQVDLFDYDKLAREHGLSWLMGAMQ